MTTEENTISGEKIALARILGQLGRTGDSLRRLAKTSTTREQAEELKAINLAMHRMHEITMEALEHGTECSLPYRLTHAALKTTCNRKLMYDHFLGKTEW